MANLRILRRTTLRIKVAKDVGEQYKVTWLSSLGLKPGQSIRFPNGLPILPGEYDVKVEIVKPGTTA